jgi:cytosine/adenosine deaminase-related metal-dependent hydrolase
MLFKNATIVTVNAAREVILDGSILVRGNLIADIGNTADLEAKYSEEEHINVTGRIVIPRLVSTHMHTAREPTFSAYLIASLCWNADFVVTREFDQR